MQRVVRKVCFFTIGALVGGLLGGLLGETFVVWITFEEFEWNIPSTESIIGALAGALLGGTLAGENIGVIGWSLIRWTFVGVIIGYVMASLKISKGPSLFFPALGMLFGLFLGVLCELMKKSKS